MCCATWKWATVISVRVVLEIAIAFGAVCCGRWVGGTCVSMVRSASIFRVLGCACNEEDCKSAKRHHSTAGFVQKTTAQYLPQLHNNNKPAVYKKLTVLLYVSAYIGHHLTSHVCTRTPPEQQQSNNNNNNNNNLDTADTKYRNTCNVTGYTVMYVTRVFARV